MSALIELKCPNRAGELEWAGGAGATSPHCGTRFLVPTEAAENLPSPECRKVERVQKASSICRQGTSSAHYNGHWGASKTELSSLLCPPAEPNSSDATATLALGLGVLLLLIMLGPLALILLGLAFFALGDGHVVFALALVAGAIIIRFPAWINILFGVRSRPRARDRCVTEKPKWEKAMNRWERLYYRARDDGVFIPGDTSLVEIKQLQDFLYGD